MFCVFITVACFIPLVCSCVLTSQCFAMRAPHRITNPRRLHAGYGSASLILGALEHTTKQRITNPRATSRYRGQKMKEPSRNLYSSTHYLDTSATKELGETLLPLDTLAAAHDDLGRETKRLTRLPLPINTLHTKETRPRPRSQTTIQDRDIKPRPRH